MNANENEENALEDENALKCDNFRDSFDRFCDDLCEEITQYLSLEDKLGYDCVNKQWKRCVFNRQYELKPNKIYSIDGNSSLMDVMYTMTQNANNSEQNGDEVISNLKFILQKCTKIKRIVIDCIEMFVSTDLIFQAIINYCNDLTAFTVNYIFNDQISDNTLKEFGIKFGETLNEIRFEGCKQLIQFCPNIVSIGDISLGDLIETDVSLKKLSEVKNMKRLYGFDGMERFTMKYSDTIKVFEVDYGCVDDSNSCKEFMSQLSKLINLEKLLLEFDDDIDISDVCNGLIKLSVKCKLKHLKLDLRGKQEEFTQLLTAINCLVELKSLRLMGVSLHHTESVELLKNCTQLMHLEIDDKINSMFFERVFEYLPKLTVIKVEIIDSIDDTLYNLANLVHLKVFELISDSLVGQTAVCNLIESCAHLRSIRFNCCPNITVETMRVLLDIATRFSRINFIYRFGGQTHKIRNIMSSSIDYGLPHNFKLIY